MNEYEQSWGESSGVEIEEEWEGREWRMDWIQTQYMPV